MRTLQTVAWMSLAVTAGVLAAWVFERPREPPSYDTNAVRLRVAEGRPPAPRPDAAEGAPPSSRGDAAEARAALESLRSDLARGDPALVEALAVERFDEAVPVLLDLLEARGVDDSLSPQVLRALETIGGGGGARGLVTIARRHPRLRDQAATRLSRLDDRVAAPQLAAVVEEEGRRGPLAAAAVRALGRTRLRQHVPLLVELAAESYEFGLRREAAEALGRIAAPEAVDVLGRCLVDSDPRLRRVAIRALGRIRSPVSIALLKDRLSRVAAAHEQELIRTALSGLQGEQRSPFQRP